MKNHVPEDVKKQRSAVLIAHSAAQEARFAGRFAGRVLPVLWEQIAGATEDGFINVGYTDNYIRVRAVDRRVLTNTITPARLGVYDPAAGVVEVTVEHSEAHPAP
jgi:tRNA A37 methylthiotransferase MiaB